MSKKITTGNFIVNINFNLRNQKPANELTDIHAVVRFNSKRVVVSGIEKVEPRYWSIKNQAPKNHIANFRASDIDNALTDARKHIKKVFEDHVKLNNAYPLNVKEFQAACKRRIKNLPDPSVRVQADKKQLTLLEYVERLKDDIKNGRRVITTGKNKGKPYAKDSHKQYGSLLTNLKGFIEQSKAYNSLDFDDIDLEFYNDFRDYIVVTQDRKPAYFGTLIKSLKTAMNDAAEFGLHTNIKHRSRKFIKETAESDAVYLETAKLDILSSLDLCNDRRLSETRDRILAGAYTGLRFSDFNKIKPEHIQGEYIRIKAQKTGERVAIPIMENLRAILDKYNGSLPSSISNQKLNENLKDLGKYAFEVGKFAEFGESVHVKKFDKGKEYSVAVPFYKLMSTHIGRRSFATNMFKRGIPTLLIMAITGHTTEKSFLTYIRMSNEDKAAMFMELIKRSELKLIEA